MKIRVVAAMLLIVAVGLPALARETTQNGVSVFDPWARATPRGTQVGSVYMVIRTAAGIHDRLVAAYTDAASAVALHTYRREGGVTRMMAVDGITIEADDTMPLVPGGFHIMLTGMTQPLREGQVFKLTLVFERAGEMIVDVEVAAVSASAPRGGYTVPGFVGPGVVIPGVAPKGSY